MTDLTPELLAQLERDAAALLDKGSVRRSWSGREIEVANGGYGVCDVTGETAAQLVRLINAGVDLVAAAKERDQLLTRQQELLATIAKLSATTPYAEEVQGWEGQRAKMIAEVGTLRAERDRAKAEISDVRGALDAHGHDGTFEAAAKLLTEVGSLRAERDQLRSRHEAAVADLHDMIAERDAGWAERDQLRKRVASLEDAFHVEHRCLERARAQLPAASGEPLWTEIVVVMGALRNALGIAEKVSPDELTDIQQCSLATARRWLDKYDARPPAEMTEDLALLEERDRLRAEVSMLCKRNVGDRNELAAHVRALLHVIDRKSYSSAAQQEALRAAEAAIGGVP